MSIRLLAAIACAVFVLSGCAVGLSSGVFYGGGTIYSSAPLNAGSAIGSFRLDNVGAVDCNGLPQVTATGSISGTTLTVATVPAPIDSTSQATFTIGGRITGKGVRPHTIVLAQLSGTTGQQGTYTVNRSQTVASTLITGHLNANEDPTMPVRASVPDKITGHMSWKDTVANVTFSCEFDVPNTLLGTSPLPVSQQGASQLGNLAMGTFRGIVTAYTGSFSATPNTCLVNLLANANVNTSVDPQTSLVSVLLYPSGVTFDPSNISSNSIYGDQGLVAQTKLQFRSVGIQDVLQMCGYDGDQRSD
jgi:hypothetical protein